MTYLQCGRNGNVDKWHTYNRDETETSTNVKLTMWTKRKRWQMSYLPTWTKRKRRQISNIKCGRNGNVDKWHTYTGDERETSTNAILTDVNETETSTNGIVKMWTKRKRWQMSYLQCGRTETLTNGILTDVNETETSTNDILTMWTKRKRRQMAYIQ